MPRLPDASSLGARPIPVSRRAIVSDRSGQALGDSLIKVGDAIEQVEEKREAAELFRTEAALKEDYLAFESEARKRRGANAAGLTKDAREWWAKASERHGAALKSPRQRKIFEQSLTAMRLSSLGALQGYEAKETDVALEEAGKASVKASIDTAAVSGGSPIAVLAARSEILGTIDAMGSRRGLPPEAVAQAKRDALSEMHARVIEGLIEDDPVAAREYFAKHQDELTDATLRGRAEKTVKVGALRVRSQEVADDIEARGLSLSAALAEVRSRYSGEEEDAIVERVKARFQDREAARNLAERQTADAAWNAFARGGLEAVPASTLARLDGRTLQTMRNIELSGGTSKVKTDFGTLYELLQTARQDPAAFAAIDLRRYTDKLAPGDLEQLATRQAAVNDPAANYDAVSLDKQMEITSDQLGLKKGEDKAKLQSTISAAINARQAELKRKLTQQERQQVIDGVILEGEVPGMIFDSNRRAYEVEGTEDAARFVPAGYDEIPPEEKAKIEEALNRRRIVATPLEVMRLYRRKQATAQ